MATATRRHIKNMFERRMTALCVILVFVIMQWMSCTEVLLERAQIDYYNKKYFSNMTAYIKRHARRSPYYLNVEGTVVQILDNNITFYGVFYEYLHNEYKRGFVEVNFKLCDLFYQSPWKELVGTALQARGGICPIPPGTYKFNNYTLSTEHLPYVWPFEKGMLRAHAQHKPSKDIVARASLYLVFKRTLSKKI